MKRETERERQTDRLTETDRQTEKERMLTDNSRERLDVQNENIIIVRGLNLAEHQIGGQFEGI